MNVFIDANILVSVLNKEYPSFSNNARILSLQDQKGFRLFTTPICIAIAFYFAEKKNKKTALAKIQMLSQNLYIAPVKESTVQKTILDKGVKDFEDGLEYYAALENNCTCIVTEDTADFYFSKIEVLQPVDFIKQYMNKL